MTPSVLACDYDGTLAHHGRVDLPTLAALKDWRARGGSLLLITGRVLPELRDLLPELNLFDLVVAENGGLLFRPAADEESLLAPPADLDLAAALRRRGVADLSIGRTILATWRTFDASVRQELAARDHLALTYNKDALMILPRGIDKASGLRAAAAEWGLPLSAFAGVGDAENDRAFLELCGFSAAVANALPDLKETVDLVTRAERGAGVVELVEVLTRWLV